MTRRQRESEISRRRKQLSEMKRELHSMENPPQDQIDEFNKLVAEFNQLKKVLHREHIVGERWADFVSKRGCRYAGCTVSNFTPPNDAAKAVLEGVNGYLAKLHEHVTDGNGIVFYGSAGTGKDHLMAACIRRAIECGFSFHWENGIELFARLRSLIQQNELNETYESENLTRPQILAISDPLPVRGDLKDFQANFLFDVLDARYSQCKPTWATLNVATREELDQRLGTQNADRLLDRATPLFCSWPSHRKARK